MTTRRQFAAATMAAACSPRCVAAPPSDSCPGECAALPTYLANDLIVFNRLSSIVPQRVKLPVRKVVPRPLLSTFQKDNPQMCAALVDAYRKLARIRPPAGSTPLPNNGMYRTGLLNHARMHQHFCYEMSQDNVHATWAFLLWHRGFLYFHERILASQMGTLGAEFRLPVWDWENFSSAKSTAVPKLWADCRVNTDIVGKIVRACPRLYDLPFPINDCRLQAWLWSDNFTDFIGGPAGYHAPVGQAMGGLHNDVHSGISGAMSDLSTAAARSSLLRAPRQCGSLLVVLDP